MKQFQCHDLLNDDAKIDKLFTEIIECLAVDYDYSELTDFEFMALDLYELLGFTPDIARHVAIAALNIKVLISNDLYNFSSDADRSLT